MPDASFEPPFWVPINVEKTSALPAALKRVTNAKQVPALPFWNEPSVGKFAEHV